MPTNTEADHVIRRIAEEVDSIGLERCGTRGNTGDDFGEEHAGIDAERDPERPPPLRLFCSDVGRAGIVYGSSRPCVTSSDSM